MASPLHGGLRTAALCGLIGCAWQPLCGVVVLWAVHAHGRRPKDERMVDGPLEDLVFLNYCNLLVFLGWAKIVAI